MEKDAPRNRKMIKAQKSLNLISVFGFFLSGSIVACGQPARLSWLGGLAAVFGFTLFFCTLPKHLNGRQRFFSGAIWFAAIQLVQLSWMTSIEFQGYYVLVMYTLLATGLAAQFGLLTWILPKEGTIPFAKIVFCAALWTLMEWLRLFFLCGFSWNPVGLSLSCSTLSLQFTALFGIFGMSFWAMLTNLYGVNVWRAQRKVLPTLSWAALASVPYLFGAFHLFYHTDKSRSLESQMDVALVQTALLPSQKIPYPERMQDFIPPVEQWRRIIRSLKEKQMTKWDLIVLPEAVVPLSSDLALYQYETIRELFISEFGHDIILQFPPLLHPYGGERRGALCVSNLFLCQVLANHYQSEVVAGLDHTDVNQGKNFNSAFYVKPLSLDQQRYDKQVLLPLAEYLPCDLLLPLAKSYGIHDFFTQGSGAKIFGEKLPFSIAICYEETFAEIMREGRKRGAELFINVTNDNYYPRTALHEQHFYHARLRAVENGVPLLRACNSGVTAVVNSFGEVVERLGDGEGVLSCRLGSYRYATLFSFWGEAGIVGLCLLSVFAFLRLKYSL